MRAIVLSVGLIAASSLAHAADAQRQAEVRERGAVVMPFSIADTLHTFETTPDGGVQRVEARAGHPEQVPHVRAHLKRIAEAFSSRDFSGPAHIHGEAMPGLAELRAAPAGELAVTYSDIENGAEVRYAAKSASLVDAIHRWFAAQLSDHGHDATAHHHGS